MDGAMELVMEIINLKDIDLGKGVVKIDPLSENILRLVLKMELGAEIGCLS
jgi:hypothetical protein